MSKTPIVFLMYHELALPGRPIYQNEPGYVRYVLDHSDFESQIEHLKANGWQGLSVGSSLAYPEGRYVAITFDDGCETDLLAAAPILRQAEFGATFFITTGKLGTPGYLSSAQLRALSALGFEIGCHSMTHPYLNDLDEKGLHTEIVEAKYRLEQITGKIVEHFSCPGGRYNQLVLKMARNAGYSSVCTSRIHANTEHTNRFALGRIAMLRDVPLRTFDRICQGRTLSRMRAKAMLREAARRVLGNSLYDRIRTGALHP